MRCFHGPTHNPVNTVFSSNSFSKVCFQGHFPADCLSDSIHINAQICLLVSDSHPTFTAQLTYLKTLSDCATAKKKKKFKAHSEKQVARIGRFIQT